MKKTRIILQKDSLYNFSGLSQLDMAPILEYTFKEQRYYILDRFGQLVLESKLGDINTYSLIQEWCPEERFIKLGSRQYNYTEW